MNLTNRIKRNSLLLVLLAGSAALWVAVPSYAVPEPAPCPYGETAPAEHSNAQTPENPQPHMAVLHKPGTPAEKILCLPESAAEAHVRHGDTPMGPCPKPGNQTP